MANRFSLSKGRKKAFPETAEGGDGAKYPIDADFRTALKILRLLDDEDVLEGQKIQLMLKWFYKAAPPPDMHEAVQMLFEFIRGDGDGGEKTKQQFDFEFDAEEIYASFLQVYSVDLLSAGFLHWRKFEIMFGNLPPECPFSRKIQLRHMDLKGYKGEDYTRLARAKRSVQIPERLSREEAEKIAKLMEMLH